jgi:hypothetical protein
VVIKFFYILRDIVEVLKHHDSLERQEIKTGLGIYHKDDARYIRVQRSKKE